jgi:hypothetical protein
MDRRSVATRRRPVESRPADVVVAAPAAPPPPVPTAQEVADIVFAGRRVDERRGLPSASAPLPTIDSVLTASRLEAEAVGATATGSYGDLVVSMAIALLWFGGVGRFVASDVALVGVIALLAPSLLRRFRRFDVEALVASGLGLFGAITLSLVLHASTTGVRSFTITMRLFASVVIADHVARSAFMRRGHLLRILTIGLGAQVMIFAAYRTTGRPWGSARGFGLVANPSVVGSLAVVVVGLGVAAAVSARRVDRWTAASVLLAGAAVAGSTSVTTVAGLLVVGAAALAVCVRRNVVRPVWVVAVALLIVGALPGWALARDGWSSKSSVSKSAFIDWRTSVRAGVEESAAHRWIGTGVGQSETSDARPILVPLQVLNETGSPGVFALSGVVLSLVLLARRRRAPPWLPLSALAVPLLHDPWMWTSAAGMTVTALGFGGAMALSRESNVTEVTSPA